MTPDLRVVQFSLLHRLVCIVIACIREQELVLLHELLQLFALELSTLLDDNNLIHMHKLAQHLSGGDVERFLLIDLEVKEDVSLPSRKYVLVQVLFDRAEWIVLKVGVPLVLLLCIRLRKMVVVQNQHLSKAHVVSLEDLLIVAHCKVYPVVEYQSQFLQIRGLQEILIKVDHLSGLVVKEFVQIVIVFYLFYEVGYLVSYFLYQNALRSLANHWHVLVPRQHMMIKKVHDLPTGRQDDERVRIFTDPQ